MFKYKSIKNFILFYFCFIIIIIIIFFFFLHYIRMEPASQNNGINTIKEARKLFNEVRKKQMKLEKSSIKRNLYIIF